MANRVFLDTNVILDIIGAHRVAHEDAKKIWKMLVHEGTEIVVSEDMLSTIYYINEDKRYALEFFRHIQKKWDVVSFGKSVIEDAITLALEKDLDFEDVLPCLCAKEHACDMLITNDKKFYDCGLEILNTKAFINKNIVK